MECYENQNLPFEEKIEFLKVQNIGNISSIFQAMFIFSMNLYLSYHYPV